MTSAVMTRTRLLENRARAYQTVFTITGQLKIETVKAALIVPYSKESAKQQQRHIDALRY